MDLSAPDEDAEDANSTDIRRLSRYHMENVIRCQDGDSLLLFFKQASDVVHNLWGDKVGRAVVAQDAAGFGISTSICGDMYTCVRVSVSRAHLHHDMKFGRMSRAEFRRRYRAKDSFGMTLDRTGEELLSIQWRQIVELAEDILIFGPPTKRSLQYEEVFRWKTDGAKLRSIFLTLSRETFGDSYSSQSLRLAYKDRLVEVMEDQMDKEDLIRNLLTFKILSRSLHPSGAQLQ